MPFTTLADHCLTLAAGTGYVDAAAYEKYGLNLARVQALGRAYRQGWLHNLLRRVTPLTARNPQDYVQMADLFIENRQAAEQLCKTMAADLTAFATAAGVYATAASVPPALQAHVGLYRQIAAVLQAKFAFTAPAPFTGGRLDAKLQAELPFIRGFVPQAIAARA